MVFRFFLELVEESNQNQHTRIRITNHSQNFYYESSFPRIFPGEIAITLGGEPGSSARFGQQEQAVRQLSCAAWISVCHIYSYSLVLLPTFGGFHGHGGTPSHHPFLGGMFHEILTSNFVGSPMAMETSIWVIGFHKHHPVPQIVK